MQLGKIDISHELKRRGNGNEIMALLTLMPSAMILAAAEASMKKGIVQVFWSVMRERTNPGQTTLTFIPSGLSLTRSASPYALTAALLALYDGQVDKPW